MQLNIRERQSPKLARGSLDFPIPELFRHALSRFFQNCRLANCSSSVKNS